MHGIDRMRWLRRLLVLLCLSALPQFAAAQAQEGAAGQAQRQVTQPGNNAPFWRDVREGINPYQTTQVRGVDTKILVQPGGETWREIRNGPISLYGGLLLIVVPFLILGFYRWKGPLKVHEGPTGRLIERFSDWDRIVHWSTAISFVILAFSGLVILFGKHVILPVFGYTLFSWLAIAAKNLHNFVGPLFVFCTLVMFVTFVRDNVWRRLDWLWVKKGGGLATGEHVPSGRFNAGEKAWFWFGVTLLGIVVGISGLILDFPNFDQTRAIMQQANVVHAIAAILYMAMSLGHIYLGTIGAEGAYEAMRHGVVDETWAKEHHEVWYEEVKAGTARQHFVDDVPPEVRIQVEQAIKA
jgi:formate dehydrogenase subunit gamma